MLHLEVNKNAPEHVMTLDNTPDNTGIFENKCI